MPTESDETGGIRPERHSRSLDREISAIAERHDGVISHEQLVDLGLTAGEIKHRIRAGRLIRLHREVYAVGYRPLTENGRFWGAVLAAGDGAVLSHQSAGRVWRLWLPAARLIHVTVPGVQRRCHRGVEVHRNRLDQGEVTVHRRMPVTTPLRTLVDLASVVQVNELERAIRQAEYEHLATAADLAAVVETLDGRRGIRKLRRALAGVVEAPGVTRSKLEEKFLRFLRGHSLPRPRLNVPMRLAGRPIEVDCVWTKQRVIVELDGRAAHATAAAFESDRARDAALQAAGYSVVRVTWRRLQADRAELARELRAILTRRK